MVFNHVLLQRYPDSTHVIAAVHALSLLELVGETMRRGLDEAAQLSPE